MSSETNIATIRSEVSESNILHFTIEGRLDANSAGRIWKEMMVRLDAVKPKTIFVDGSRIEYCDLSGISLFLELQRRLYKVSGELKIKGMKTEYIEILKKFHPADIDKISGAPGTRRNFTEEIGRTAFEFWKDIQLLIVFLGEMTTAFLQSIRHPGRIRWKDTIVTVENAGVDALPIVMLISFLIGLIMSFQAAIPMRMFGAEIYVADLIALSMTRELGPLMTAIIMAGRSGSAFAAELGTMKVNEEIDALTTMGIDPMKFLVVPKMIASIFVTPLLAVFADLVGIIGGAVVLLSLGFPLITYVNEVVSAIDSIDYLSGLVKCFVFGALISGIGCLRGLQTQTGPSAVGDSTTRSVVSGIVLIIVTDGIFSVVYFYLGI